MRIGETLWLAGLVVALALGATSAHAAPAAEFSAPVALEAEPVVEASSGSSPVVASDGSSWLVVYRAREAWLGQIIGSDGQPSALPFDLGPQVWDPELVFDGESYVVLFNAAEGIFYERVSTAGKVLGEPQLLQAASASGRGQRVVAAGGDSRVLALVCDDVEPCQAWIINQNGAPTRSLTLMSRFTALAFSEGTWLVLVMDSLITLRQLDGTVTLIDGTTKVLADAPPLIYAAVAPAADGFAIAWPGASSDTTRLALVDFAGSISVKAPLSRLPSFPPQFAMTSGGYALRLDQDLQLLSSALAPLDMGQLALSPYGALATNGAERALFLADTAAVGLEVELLSLTPAPSKLGTAQIALAPPTQQLPLGVPTDDGWLVAWEEERAATGSARSLRAVRLDEAGVPASLPFLVTDDDSLFLMALSPGPQQRSLLIAAIPWEEPLPGDPEPAVPYLELFLIGPNQSVAQRPQLGPLEKVDDRPPVQVAASGAGWLIAWSGTDGLHGTRISVEGTQVDDTLLASGRYELEAVALQGSAYRVFWRDGARRSSLYRDIAAGGAIAVEAPRVLFTDEDYAVSSLYAAASDDAWWFLGTTPCTSNTCRARGQHQVRFGADNGLAQALPFTDPGALVAVDGVALAGVFDRSTLRFGLAEPGGELELSDSFADRMQINLSAAKDNRVLLSFTESSSGTWGTPTLRVSASVVTVTGGLDVSSGGGAGGNPGGGAGAEAAGGTPSSSLGGVATSDAGESSDSAGFGGEPSPADTSHTSRSCGCRTPGGAEPTSAAAAAWALLGTCLLLRRRSLRRRDSLS